VIAFTLRSTCRRLSPTSSPSRSVGRGVVLFAETPEGSGHATGKIRVDQKVLGHSHLSIKMLYTHVVDGKPEDAMKGLYGPLVDRGEEKNGCESYRIADPLTVPPLSLNKKARGISPRGPG